MSNLFNRKKVSDYLVLMALGFWIFFVMSKVGAWLTPPENFDAVNYMKMAQNPFAFLDPHILPHHAQRMFPSWVVGVLHLFGLSYSDAFFYLSRVLFMIWTLGTFLVLQGLGISRWLSLSLVALLPFCFWAYRYPLTNIFQLNDLCAHALPIFFIYAVQHKKLRFLMILSIISVLSRQNLVVLVATSYLFLFFKQKDFKILFQAVPAALVFALSTFLSGGGASEQLQNHTSVNLNAAWAAFFHSKIYLIVMPFVLWCFSYKAWMNCFGKYLWITIFVLLTALQPMMHYHHAGPSNFERIFAQASWWLIFPAGMSLQALYGNRSKFFAIFVVGSTILLGLVEANRLPQIFAPYGSTLNIGISGLLISVIYYFRRMIKKTFIS